MKETQIDPTFPIPGDIQILVEKVEAEQKTESGIIIPELTANANDKQLALTPIGIVVAAGCACKRLFGFPIAGTDATGADAIVTKRRPLQVGDRIYFNRYANLTLTHKGKSYLLMSEIDAYCLIPSEETVVTTLAQKAQQRPNIDREVFRKGVGLDPVSNQE